MKRWISLLLALTMVCSLVVPAAAATTFPDLSEDHWAYSFIQDLVENGIYTGYGDGTIRPSTNTSILQTLAILSRFYTLSDGDQAYLYADYGATAEAIVPSTSSWAYDEVAVCLAAGIVTESELRAYPDLNAYITREDLAVFLVRAMQLEDEARSRDYASLNFTDTESIDSDALFDIDLLVNMEIVSGYTDGTFRPQLSSTRAVVAKMISLALDYLEENKITLTVPGYNGLTRASGLLAGYDATSVSITDTNGLTRRFARTSAANVTINGSTGTLSPSYLGSAISLTAQSGDVTELAVTYHETTDYVQGEVSFLSTAAATGPYISVLTAEGKTVSCTVNADTAYSGTKTTYNDLAAGDFVTICRKSSVAESVIVAKSEQALTGSVAALTYSVDNGLLLVTDASGAVWSFSIAYGSVPTVTSGGLTASLSAVSVGDGVKLTVRAGVLKTIAKESVTAEYSGTLSYIGQSLTGTEWTLTQTDGTAVTLPLSAGATFATSSGSKLTSANISLGDTLTVQTNDGTITSVVRTAQATSSGETAVTTSVSGTVLYVDTSAYTMLALIDGQPITLNLRSARLQNTSGNSVQMRSITSGASFLAYGTYSDSATIAATLVIFN
jgi:hypothetical protein